jgi:DNA-binding CsgD family transcriptional regulator
MRCFAGAPAGIEPLPRPSMSKVTPIDAGRRRSSRASNALERRLLRLERRLLDAEAPIVWLCACAGTGKTRLLETLRPGLTDRGWCLLDDPSAASLERALELVTRPAPVPRTQVLVASRPNSAIVPLLLKPRAYGLVETLADPELFVRTEDTEPDEEKLLVATGGWPWLVAAALEGRERAARALLPQFLEREVLPTFTERALARLIAAASMPLPLDSLEQPADEDVFLLRAPRGTRIAGDWVRAALLTMRRCEAARTPRVREYLMAAYASLPDPAPAIEALLGLGDHQSAFELFRKTGGAYYGYHHGYHALERVLGLFGPELGQRSEELFLARLWMLVKTGKTREALLRLEARHPGLPVDLRRLRLSYRPELLLLRADMSLDLDGTPPLEVIASWGRLQAFMAPNDELSSGLLYNSMAIGYLQADAIIEARQLAEEALAAYQRAGLPYLVHYMHVHLAEIALRQSRLADAAVHIERAEDTLRASGQAFNSEYAIIRSLRSRLAFEQGRFEDCAAEINPLLEALIVGDSWPDLIPRVAEQVALAALWRGGLKCALEQLDRCALAQSRRHGITASRQLTMIRIRLLQAARRHAEAGMLLEEYELASEARPSAALEVQGALVRLRGAIVRDSSRAERVRLIASLAQHPALETRQRISLALLEAAARNADGAEALARRHLRIALREAEAQGLIAVLIEDGECLERLLPGFIAAPGPGNGRLASFAASVLKILKNLATAPMRSKDLAGLSRQEHRVLSYAADGYSNKETARELPLSESTVKFHLRSLFKKLEVDSRAGLFAAARARGIVT